MNHLTPDELIDAVEEALAPERRAHVHQCPACHQHVLQLSAVLRESREIDVPEPSPLFWESLSERVRSAIAAEPSVPRLLSWFQWPVLAPVAALALIVFALISAVPQVRVEPQSDPIARHDEAAANVLALTDALEESWVVVSELVGDLDIEAAQEAGIAVGPGSAEGVVLQLSSAEQQELIRLLRAELQRAGS